MLEDEAQRARKVRFHGRVQFKTIRHVSEFSEDEIHSGWYRKKDFVRMSEEVSEIAQLVAKGTETHNGEELSIRGLEHLVEEDVADYRAEKMIASIDAVLDEQDEQREEDFDDPDVIAEIYSEIVAPLQREAYLVGLRDAKEGAAAAAQLADIEDKDTITNMSPEMVLEEKKDKSKPRKQPKPPKPQQDFTDEEEPLGPATIGELNDAKEAESKPKIKLVVGKKGTQTAASQAAKKAPAKRKDRRTRLGKATESTPLVRRRDGTFTFRNKADEATKAELSKQRRDCVRDALFKHLDSNDVDDLGIP